MSPIDIGRRSMRWCLILLLPVAALTAAAPAGAASGSSDAVRSAQQTLKQSGYDPGPADGVVGPRTKAALASYQRAQGLAPTARLDAATVAKLGAPVADPDHVRSVQAALKDAGHDPGALDGMMGPQTKAALRQYAAAPTPTASSPRSPVIDEFLKSYRPQSP